MQPRERTKNILIHTAGWLIYGLIIFSWISSGRLTYETSLAITFRMLFLHSLLFYLNLYVLLPRLMEKNQYLAYALSILVLLAAVFFLRQFISELIPFEFQPGQDPAGINRPVVRERRTGLSFRAFLDMMSSLAVLFFSTAYWVGKQNRIREKQTSLLTQENLENKLKLLKNQVNPHFLFNALNNIYSLSLTKSELAPEMLVKLSEMLRYVLYECNEPRVPLSKEVEYIRHFIEFQKIKLENGSGVTFDTQLDNQEILIEPMLFIPFIENAFKHGSTEQEDTFIHIHLECRNNEVHFRIENSLPSNDTRKDVARGIGISNVRNRLSLMYPGRHSLDIEHDEKVFRVNLKIQL